MIKDKNNINLGEDSSNIEINNLRNKIRTQENDLTKIKQGYNNLTLQITKLKNINNNLQNKLSLKNIEEKQMKVIDYYLRKEMIKDFDKYNNNDKSILKSMLVEAINNKYNLYLDSENFIKISLYYIKSKLIDYLTDKKTLKIFENPMISKDGRTFDTQNPSIDLVNNNLVNKICKILKENKNIFSMEHFYIVKQLLTNEQTNNYYINPVVVSCGNNKGDTVEGRDKNQNYKNIVIKNIIDDFREMFEDGFFNFEVIGIEDMKKYVNFNKIMVVNFLSGDGLINEGIKCLKTETFAEVEEKLYKKYDKYRETNNNFLCGGNVILRFKTLEENKIKDGDKIQLQLIDI